MAETQTFICTCIGLCTGRVCSTNTFPICVYFAAVGWGREGKDGGKVVGVVRAGGGGPRGGATGVLLNVSWAVWGGFGYQGAAGVHSVVFRSWAHWPPEHSQSRHNELLMTLWVTGRKRASAHTQHNGEATQAPHVWCPRTYKRWHTHRKNSQSQIQMYSDKK